MGWNSSPLAKQIYCIEVIMKNYIKKIVMISLALVFLAVSSPEVSASENNSNLSEESSTVGVILSKSAVNMEDLTQENGIPLEIERKFIINPDDLSKETIARADRYELVQTYISYNPEVRVRQATTRVYGRESKRHYFTLKLPKDEIGLSRSELEFQIYPQVYQDMIKKQVGQTIYKTRLQFKEGEHIVSVDIYHGNELTGLAVVEVEFDSLEAAASFVPPKWFGLEVTADQRYKNANLAKSGKPTS